MNYVEKTTTFSEIPGESCLVYTIPGCPLRCEDCHSPYLRNRKIGVPLTLQVVEEDLSHLFGAVTCVLFMGGEWEPEMLPLLESIQGLGLKTALYSGEETLPADLEATLDYVKLGPYIKERGGLTDINTNQVLLELPSRTSLNHLFHPK